MAHADLLWLIAEINRLKHTCLALGGTEAEFTAMLTRIADELRGLPLGEEQIAPDGAHEEPCPDCNGRGDLWDPLLENIVCSTCDGRGTVEIPGPAPTESPFIDGDDPFNPEGDPIRDTESFDDLAPHLGPEDDDAA